MIRDYLKSNYLKLIYDAMEKVPRDYQRIGCAGTNKPVYRERVYCYELYHQMRLLQKSRAKTLKNNRPGPLVINGEIDKRGHMLIGPDYNPDFVIHEQGSMEHNHCVIEVKTTLDAKGVKKDLKTISSLISKYNYDYGVLIIIGSACEEVKETITSLLLPTCLDKKCAHNIFLFIQPTISDPGNIHICIERLSDWPINYNRSKYNV